MSNFQVLTPDQERVFLLALGGAPSDGRLVFLENHEQDIDLKLWKSRRNLVGVLLMLDVGLRVGEVVCVTYNDVFFEGQPSASLIVRAEIAKGRRQRIVPMSERLKAALRRFNQEPYLFESWPLTQVLLAKQPQGPALTVRAIQKMTKRESMKSIGIEVNPHMLRHTLATRLMQVCDIRTVQMILGHKNLSTTQVYTHPNSEDCRKAIAALSTGKPVGVKLLGDNKGPRNEIQSEISI